MPLFGFPLVSPVFGVMTVQQSLPLNQGDVAKEKNLKTDALKLPRQGRVSTSGQLAVPREQQRFPFSTTFFT